MPKKKNPRPYGKNEYIAKSAKIDQFQQGKGMLSESDYSREEVNRMKDWNTLFRMYPSVFVEWWLEIPLFPYQRYWIDLMAQSTTFLAVASRGTAKSMMIGLLSCVKAILYPLRNQFAGDRGGVRIGISVRIKKCCDHVICH